MKDKYLEYTQNSQNSRGKSNPIRKWENDIKRHPTEGDI